MTNRIGLPVTGQQQLDILTNCHNDRYAIEVRHVGQDSWSPTGLATYPAEIATRFVRDLNAAGALVFRAVLSSSVGGAL